MKKEKSSLDVVLTFIQQTKDRKYAEVSSDFIEVKRIPYGRGAFEAEDQEMPLLYSVSNKIGSSAIFPTVIRPIIHNN